MDNNIIDNNLKKQNDILYHNEILMKQIYKSKKSLNENIKNYINDDNNDSYNINKKNIDKKSSKRILPKIDKNISLSSFGYKLSKSDKTRKTSLKRASNEYGILNVLKRVNLIRNYSKSIPKNYDKLSKDVSFIKKEYSKNKIQRKSSIKLYRKSSNKLYRKSSNK